MALDGLLQSAYRAQIESPIPERQQSIMRFEQSHLLGAQLNDTGEPGR